MSLRVWMVAPLVLALSVTSAAAGTKKKHRHRAAPVVQTDIVPPWGGREVGPAHFVRLPNGLIVSSYECFYDEGYGRYLACGAGRK